MPRFLVVNPNTSREMTEAIANTVQSSLGPGNRADVISAQSGPKSLESYHEYNLASVAVVETLGRMDISGYQGLLLACFGDPGLYGLKELLRVPVVGIAEASLSISLLLGESFAVLCAGQKAVPMMENMIRQYGLTARSAGVFALGTTVLGLEEDEADSYQRLVRTARKAVSEGAEVLILGCAGMTGFSRRLEEELGAVILDPVKVGLKTLETLVSCGLGTSRVGLYQAPPSKEIKGMENLTGSWIKA